MRVPINDEIRLEDDLTLKIADRAAKMSPSEALRFSEVLVRKAFRRALLEEAAASE